MAAESLVEIITPSQAEIQQRLASGESVSSIQEDATQAANIARLGSAGLALILDQDVGTAIQTSTLAVENNFMITMASNLQNSLYPEGETEEDRPSSIDLDEIETLDRDLNDYDTDDEAIEDNAYARYRQQVIDAVHDVLNCDDGRPPHLATWESLADGPLTDEQRTYLEGVRADHALDDSVGTAMGQTLGAVAGVVGEVLEPVLDVPGHLAEYILRQTGWPSRGDARAVHHIVNDVITLATAARGATSAVRAGRRIHIIDTKIKWGRGIQAQGMPWEDYLATTLPADARLPRNFKTFDFFDPETRTAISAKTLNTLTPSKLANPEQIYYSLKRNIDVVASFTEARLGIKEITYDMI